MNKNDYMKLALAQAKKAYEKDEVPVGCVIVFNNEVIAKSFNQKIRKNDPTSHAEIECIKKACKKLNSMYLNDCEMYVTLEPCLMCAGAIVHARLKKVYIGTQDPKGGAFGSSCNILDIQKLNHYPEVEQNVCKEECAIVLKDFFRSKRG